jgi:hypothetical protein
MQLDMHYYGTAVIANAAGFTPDQARLIAYAAQYVDDADDDEVLGVGGARFTPVRTAHYGLTMFTARTEADIHLPFHFPPAGYVGGGMAGYRVQADSPLVRELVAAAGRESNPALRLCRLGVALHTYADTWSHDGFSAWLEGGNDVSDIEVRQDGHWKPLGLAELPLDLLPAMGHFQAGFLPDEPYRVWRNRRPQAGEACAPIIRDNPALYLEAVDAIYARLREACGGAGQADWPATRAKIAALLPQGGPERHERACLWIAAFPELFGDPAWRYDPERWRERALSPAPEALGEGCATGEVYRAEQADTLAQRWVWAENPATSPWVNFHQAALLQRGLVQRMVFFA